MLEKNPEFSSPIRIQSRSKKSFQMNFWILASTTTTAKTGREMLEQGRLVEMVVVPFSHSPWHQRIHKMEREMEEVRGTSSW